MLTINKERQYISVENENGDGDASIFRVGETITVCVVDYGGTLVAEETIPIADFLDALGIKKEEKQCQS